MSFTLKGVCSYILYWAVEDSKVADGNTLIESNELISNDQERVKKIIDAIIADGRIIATNKEAFSKL